MDTLPVSISIDIENLSVSRESFYNVCFIVSNDEVTRDVEVTTLKELLDSGYKRGSLAYNFCVGVFSQGGMSSVYIRAKRSWETYIEAYESSSNNDYYFVVIDSKNTLDIKTFNNYLVSTGDIKLLFYSNITEVLGGDAVGYHQEEPLIFSNTDDTSASEKVYKELALLVNLDLMDGSYPEEFDDYGLVNKSDYYIAKAFTKDSVYPDDNSLSTADYQTMSLAYPESAWIGLCGNKFPSSVHWLYKYLAKVDVNQAKNIPDSMTTTSTVLNNTATVGSGSTASGIPIHEKVSIDWVKWALSRKLWNTLYTQDKINAAQGGLDIITNDIKIVLDTAVTESIFTEYRIVSASLDRNTNTVSVKFEASLSYTILEVELSGSLYY